MYEFIPLFITMSYIIVAILMGYFAGRGRDMNNVEEWGVGSRSFGPIMMYLLIGVGGVSAYTYMGSPGWAYSKGAPALYVVVYLTYMTIIALGISARKYGSLVKNINTLHRQKRLRTAMKVKL